MQCRLEQVYSDISGKDLTGTLAMSRSEKGGNQTGEEADKMGSRCGAAGAYRGLGSRSRTERQIVQGGEVEAGGNGRVSRWAGGPRP